MKKYLRTIEWNLMLPREVRRRVMEDLNSTIAERREAGQSDEEIMAQLGKPRKVAEELNRQMQDYVLKKSPWRFVFLAAAVLSSIWILLEGLVWKILSELLTSQAHSLGIIGGADGPTAIFITSGGTDWDLILASVVFAAGIAGWLWLRRGRK